MHTELRVRFHELDPNGHVNHGVYMNWFETARIELLDDLGFGLDTLRERDIHIVVTHANLHFCRPALGGDLVTVETEIRELRRATSWWHQRAVRDGEVLAEADVRSGTIDAKGTPTIAPEDLTRALRDLQREHEATANRSTRVLSRREALKLRPRPPGKGLGTEYANPRSPQSPNCRQ